MTSGGQQITSEEEAELRQELASLREEHGDLDVAITALIDSAPSDTIPLQRLKKKKLALKDQIQALEDRLFPDIIA